MREREEEVVNLSAYGIKFSVPSLTGLLRPRHWAEPFHSASS